MKFLLNIAGVLFATFWGMVAFGDFPDIWTYAGALVIIAAGIYVWHRETLLARKATRE